MEKNPFSPKRPIAFGATPPPSKKAMGIVKEITTLRVSLEPIFDKAAKAGGKKQTENKGWQNITICRNRSDARPINRVEMPVSSNTRASVGFRPKRSVSHPINNAVGNVNILDMVISVLAWDWSIPCSLERNKGSRE